MKNALVFLLLGLTGCMTLPDQSQYTPEQLKAMSRDRATVVQCFTANSLLYGRVTSLFVNIDMAKLSGTVVTNADCTTVVTVTVPAP